VLSDFVDITVAAGRRLGTAQETWTDSYSERSDFQTTKTGRCYDVQKL